MSDDDAAPRAPIVGVTGVYNADGGLWGEARYVVGHLLGTDDCALCDITHSPVRRKPAWDRMVKRSAVPIDVVHRNELDTPLRRVVQDARLPALFARRADGTVSLLLDAAQLASLDGSVDRFEQALRDALARETAGGGSPRVDPRSTHEARQVDAEA